jgi:uncharacterized protein YbjT (DUF2867 family)
MLASLRRGNGPRSGEFERGPRAARAITGSTGTEKFMIVVTGATGNIGRPLVAALAAAGKQVTAVSRRLPGSGVPAGVVHRQADLGEPGHLEAAVAGADALFLLLTGELLVGGEDPRDVLKAATGGGVRQVVLLSSQAAGTRPQAPSHSRFRAFEEAVQQAGPDWTILRPAGFDSNACAWAELIRAQQLVAAPFGDVGLPFIDPADIAAVAAAVLLGGDHAGRTYELTGPAPISPREQAQAIGVALGAPLRFAELSRAEARAYMLQFMPEPVADGTLDILGEPTAAEQRVSPDVEQLLRRPAGTFAGWAARNVTAFR